MAATLGKVEEFDSSKEDWQQYTERLNHFFVANGIADAEKKRAVFLSVIGPATYKILRNLTAPQKPGEESFEDLVERLSKHYRPAPSEIVERCKFHSRYRRPGEFVATFVAELRCLSEFCNLGTVLENMLRDRLVCGINDDAMQKRLLAESKLTYKRAIELAQSLEMADKNVKELKTKRLAEHAKPSNYPQQPQEVLKLTGAAPGQANLTCYRCGNAGHLASKCKVSKDMVCRSCGKPGHLQKACRSRSKSKSTKPKKSQSKTVCRVQEDESDEEPLYHVSSHGKSKAPPILVKVQVDDCLVTMEVDTGAAVTLVSETTWPGQSFEATSVRLCSYSKELIPVVG